LSGIDLAFIPGTKTLELQPNEAFWLPMILSLLQRLPDLSKKPWLHTKISHLLLFDLEQLLFKSQNGELLYIELEGQIDTVC
jgi:hypothetical protein